MNHADRLSKPGSPNLRLVGDSYDEDQEDPSRSRTYLSRAGDYLGNLVYYPVRGVLRIFGLEED